MWKSLILKFAKRIIERAKSLNEIQLSKDSLIDDNIKLSGTKIDGSVIIKTGSEIVDSVLYGKIQILEYCNILGAKLSGEISLLPHVHLEANVLLSGNIEIGKYSYISGPNTDVVGAVYGIRIGSFCSIARNVSIQEYNHFTDRLTTSFINTNFGVGNIADDVTSKGPVEIGHDVWIGTHCVILSGAKIGTGAIIAANSVVTDEIPPYAIAAGSPAKVIKYRFSEDKIRTLLESQWWLKDEDEILKQFKKFNKEELI